MGFFKLGKKKEKDVELSEKADDAGKQPAAPFATLDTPATPQWPGNLASKNPSMADLHSHYTAQEGVLTLRDAKCDVMAQWLQSKQEEKIWTRGEPGEGVLVKKSKGEYAFSPPELLYDGSGLYQAIAGLNVRVC
jgi:hypothetical protein